MGATAEKANQNGHTKERRLRLVKVQVMAVMALDDGETLTEVVADPIIVTAADWPEWASKAFTPDALAALAQTIPLPPAT